MMQRLAPCVLWDPRDLFIVAKLHAQAPPYVSVERRWRGAALGTEFRVLPGQRKRGTLQRLASEPLFLALPAACLPRSV